MVLYQDDRLTVIWDDPWEFSFYRDADGWILGIGYLMLVYWR